METMDHLSICSSCLLLLSLRSLLCESLGMVNFFPEGFRGSIGEIGIPMNQRNSSTRECFCFVVTA